ncbi:hypothetical protein EIK77_007475 [Talaromyces pinophilus]|nr:hypothetical protein EIK77_007475 [Talaromyces pinophilus]
MSFVELITKFEDFTKSKRGRSAYATFGSNNTGFNKLNKAKPTLQERPCPCGQLKSVHPKWEDCEYCNEDIRDDDWTLDPKIAKKVAENTARYKPLKEFIQKYKKKAENQPVVNVNAVFTTTKSCDSLVDSVIHNSGATESISNNIHYMEDFVPEKIHIQGFRGSVWAEGRGIIVV